MASPGDNSRKRRAASFLDETTQPGNAGAERQIAAALAKIGRVRVHAPSTHRRLIGRVTAVCVLFVIFAFGGGLFLAHVSFNSPDRPIRISSQPELLYLPPEGSRVASVGFDVLPLQEAERNGAPRLFERRALPFDTVVAQGNVAASAGASNVQAEQERSAIARRSEEKLDLRAIAQTFADSASFTLAARMQEGQNGSPLLSGYQALEMSAIPEPSSGVIVTVVIAMIIIVSTIRRRRGVTRL